MPDCNMTSTSTFLTAVVMALLVAMPEAWNWPWYTPPSAATMRITEYVLELAASRLEWLQILNGGQCLEYEESRGALLVNKCKNTKSQQWIWDFDAPEGDTMQNMANGDQCVTVRADSIPWPGGCPPKNTELVFRNCDFTNDPYQKWFIDKQGRTNLAPCPGTCMAYHPNRYVYSRARMFVWPCVGAVVPFSVRHAMNEVERPLDTPAKEDDYEKPSKKEKGKGKGDEEKDDEDQDEEKEDEESTGHEDEEKKNEEGKGDEGEKKDSLDEDEGVKKDSLDEEASQEYSFNDSATAMQDIRQRESRSLRLPYDLSAASAAMLIFLATLMFSAMAFATIATYCAWGRPGARSMQPEQGRWMSSPADDSDEDDQL